MYVAGCGATPTGHPDVHGIDVVGFFQVECGGDRDVLMRSRTHADACATFTISQVRGCAVAEVMAGLQVYLRCGGETYGACRDACHRPLDVFCMRFGPNQTAAVRGGRSGPPNFNFCDAYVLPTSPDGELQHAAAHFF